jgi:hypothetical protein
MRKVLGEQVQERFKTVTIWRLQSLLLMYVDETFEDEKQDGLEEFKSENTLSKILAQSKEKPCIKAASRTTESQILDWVPAAARESL